MGKGNLTKHQRFEIATIQRGQITEAPYNPRIMDGANRKLLDKSMKANGLVEPLVWNKRSGVLVGSPHNNGGGEDHRHGQGNDASHCLHPPHLNA